MTKDVKGNREEIRELVFTAIGAASMCWERPYAGGIFESQRAHKIGDDLIVAIEKRLGKRPDWDQKRITRWTDETFGETRSNLSIAARANEEMAELLSCLSKDDMDLHAREEVADVIITLCRLVTRLGGDMAEDIDLKMERNVGRTWVLRGDGNGDHVEAPIVKPPIEDRVQPVFSRISNLGCVKCDGTGYTSVPFEPTTIQRCGCNCNTR